MTIVGAGLISSNGLAADAVPTPSTYADVSVPQLTGWDSSNIVTLGADAVSGATAKSHVYPSAEGAEGTVAESSVAAVYWELDNDSGRAPGIQVVTDDLDVPVNNCIMASGEIESTDFPGTFIPKTCSDEEGSSKRYFLEITSSDVPVDLAFSLGVKDIRYKGVKDPTTDDGVALSQFRDEFGIGRIYRVIQKTINNTDKRIASYKFELGTGLADDFVPLTFEEHSVAFEMRTAVPREFFDGETGAPDISVWDPLRFMTVSPKMFDDGSRARFDPGFVDHAAAGLLAPQSPADGVEKSQNIDSGLNIVDGVIGAMSANYFNVADNVSETESISFPGNTFGYQLPDSLIPMVIGEYSTNEVGGESDSVVAIWDGTNWRAGRTGLDGDIATTPNYDIIPDSQLEQWAAKLLGLTILGEAEEDLVRYDSIVSDDLSGLNTDVYIYIGDQLLDENGDLTIDSITLRVTANSVESVIGSVEGSEDPLWVTSGNEAPTLASYMAATGTPVAINDNAETIGTAAITVDVLDNDLIDGVAANTVFDPADATPDTITIVTGPTSGVAVVNVDPENGIDYTANADFSGTDVITYTVTIDGAESNEATISIEVEAAPIPDTPLANSDSAITFENTSVTLDVLDNDELYNDTPTTVVVSIDNAALNGTATVEDNEIVYVPSDDYLGFDRFTYVVTVDGVVSNSALVTIRVDEPVVVEESDDTAASSLRSSSGCSAGRLDAKFDPILPGMLFIALVGLFMRRRKNNV
jgi:hypothetical protein